MSNPVIKLREVVATEKWQQILADLVTDPKELLQILELEPRDFSLSDEAIAAFPLKVPRPFLSRIAKGDWQDPLLRQILPLSREMTPHPLHSDPDPLQESEYNPVPGLLHKYQGRVLLTVAPHCAVHCRYCFRRHFDYKANSPGRRAFAAVFDYIAKDDSIREVIFSGGDPLAASERHLSWLTDQLKQIPHLERLRIHTRTPIMIPQRVTESLLQWLDNTGFKTVMVVHCNHPNEIDDAVTTAMHRLAANNITLLNQSVLLAGVNDDATVLATLSEKLFSANVLPYYLHLLDPVPGVLHFDVDQARGLQLLAQMRATLPGYLVPKLVREQAGELAKTILA